MSDPRPLRCVEGPDDTLTLYVHPGEAVLRFDDATEPRAFIWRGEVLRHLDEANLLGFYEQHEGVLQFRFKSAGVLLSAGEFAAVQSFATLLRTRRTAGIPDPVPNTYHAEFEEAMDAFLAAIPE